MYALPSRPGQGHRGRRGGSSGAGVGWQVVSKGCQVVIEVVIRNSFFFKAMTTFAPNDICFSIMSLHITHSLTLTYTQPKKGCQRLSGCHSPVLMRVIGMTTSMTTYGEVVMRETFHPSPGIQ